MTKKTRPWDEAEGRYQLAKYGSPSPGVKPNIPQVAAKSGKHAQLRL